MNIGIFGANGKIGRLLVDNLRYFNNLILFSRSVDSIDGIRTTSNLEKFVLDSNYIIDFSSKEGSRELLEQILICKINKPIVIGTTGLEESTYKLVDEVSKISPILYSANMSLGIALLNHLVSVSSSILSDFDIEITETHHKHKKDAPSGTALSLAQSCAEARAWNLKDVMINDRSKIHKAKNPNEIGISSLRGGDVAGRHIVGFYNDGEYIELLHNATSKEVFSNGAIKALFWLKDKPIGRYYMHDMIKI